MEKSFIAVLLLLMINFCNYLSMGQSTIGESNQDAQDIVDGLTRLFKDLNIYNCEAWNTLTKNIQSEFQNLKAQISRLESHNSYLNNSIDEIKRQIILENIDVKIHIQTASDDTKTEIFRLEDRIVRHDSIMNNSFQENKRQIQRASNDTKAQIFRLEDRIAGHDSIMNNSFQENKRQIQRASNDTKAQIFRLEDRIVRHDSIMNNSFQENKRQIQTASNDTKAQILRLENRFDSHDINTKNLVDEIKEQAQVQNMEMKNEFQELIQKLPSRHCPAGFNYSVAGFPKCYAVLSDRVDWNTAQNKCKQLHENAQLPVIVNDLERKVTSEMLLNHDCRQQNTHVLTNEFWIGARRRNVSDCNSPFEWISKNGTKLPMHYINWYNGEPNCSRHGGRTERESCATINKKAASNKWNDIVCTWLACPLCEIAVPV